MMPRTPAHLLAFLGHGLHGAGELDAIAARNDPALRLLALFAHAGARRVVIVS